MERESRPPQAAQAALPIWARAALDAVALRTADGHGRPTGLAVGQPHLVEEWHRYGSGEDQGEVLIVLGAHREALAAAVGEYRPRRIIVVEAGPVARVLRPVVKGNAYLMAPLAKATWDMLGFQRRRSFGILGPGAITLALAERLLRRMDRPDLADRCRIGLLRSLETSTIGRRWAVVLVQEYARVSDG